MLIETGKLVGTGLQDTASIPVIMMGFRLTESCAVLGVDGNRVVFCGRMDLEVLADQAALPDFEDQMLAAVNHSTVDAVLLVGYSDNPAEAARLLDAFAARLFRHVTVGRCVVAAQHTVWEVLNGQLDGDGVPFCLDDELDKVEAVIPNWVQGSRAEAVAEVRPTLQVYEAAEVVLATAEALHNLDDLTPQQQHTRLRELLEGPALPLAHAVELAVLLDNPAHVAAVLDTITDGNADAHHTQLVTTNKYSPQGYEPNVIGLLALSCWLTDEGAQMSDCMEQLEQRSPGHPLLAILQQVHHLPPTAW